LLSNKKDKKPIRVGELKNINFRTTFLFAIASFDTEDKKTYSKRRIILFKTKLSTHITKK